MNYAKHIAVISYIAASVILAFGENYISAALILVCAELEVIRWTLEDKK